MKKKYSKYHVDISEKGKEDRTYQDFKTGEMIQADSLLEKQFYLENILPNIQDGTIINYEAQKKLNLQPSFKHQGQAIRAIDYVADFWVWYPDGSEKVFDVKGSMIDNVALLKRKMVYYLYPDLDYIWITKTAAGWINYDDYLIRKRQKKKLSKQVTEKVKKEKKK